MNREELKVGTSVFTSDGDEIGEVNRFVLDPETNEVTHIVIQKGGLFAEDKVVPFDMVRSLREDQLVLSEEVQDYDQLPPFEVTHYIEAAERDADPEMTEDARVYPRGPAYYWYPPYGYLGYPPYGLGGYGLPMAVTQQNIPEGSVPLKEGTDVISSDGEHVGDVERLLVDEDSSKATHFLVSQGLFFKNRKLVPAHWIRSVTEDKVQLNVSSQLLERLPAYEAD